MVAALEGVRRWIAPGALLALLGGEPLLEREKTLALAAWARRRGLSPLLSTNGLLVDRVFAEEAARLGLDCQVSVDGACAQTHEQMRGAGTFAPALEGVRLLVEAGAPTLISMVVHAGNAPEVPDFLRLGRSLGVRAARFIPLKRVGDGRGHAAPDLPALIRQVAHTVAAEPDLAGLLGRDYCSILARTCQACSPRASCGTGSQTFLLDADGTVYPCPNLARPELAVGSITREPLRRIWRTAPIMLETRRRVRSVLAGGACGRCEVHHWCLGGCRGEVYAETGKLEARSVTCEMNRAAILETMWTVAGASQGGPDHAH
jgi:radical SAM protein with 4Fe4S-binding SPASM domain